MEPSTVSSERNQIDEWNISIVPHDTILERQGSKKICIIRRVLAYPRCDSRFDPVAVTSCLNPVATAPGSDLDLYKGASSSGTGSPTFSGGLGEDSRSSAKVCGNERTRPFPSVTTWPVSPSAMIVPSASRTIS